MKKLTGVLRVTLRYSIVRNGTYYFQRPVPKDLAHRYEGRLVRKSLETKDLREATRKIISINKRLEAEWARERAGCKRAPASRVSVRKQAISLLDGWGLEVPIIGGLVLNDDALVELFYEQLEAPNAEASVEVRSEAAKLLSGLSKPTLNDALDYCLSVHPKRGNPKFVSDTERAFGKLVATVGDKAISDLARSDGHKLVAQLQLGNSASGTIRRYVNVCQSIVGMYFREHDIQRTNPLANLHIPNEGADKNKRNPYSADELKKLCEACVEINDDIRWLAALIADTGARLAEVVGLALEDIVIDHATPHIIIQRHSWRSLKNASSAREVPLVGCSLWAANQIKNEVNADQIFAFPRYVGGVTGNCRATSASNTLVKWVRGLGLEHNVHELRHTFADRLRAVHCPEDIRLSIGGWASDGVGNRYGRGYSLNVKHDWLKKIVSAAL